MIRFISIMAGAAVTPNVIEAVKKIPPEAANEYSPILGGIIAWTIVKLVDIIIERRKLRKEKKQNELAIPANKL